MHVGSLICPAELFERSMHHTTTAEHPRLVADPIVQSAKLVGRENVIAGTDCGFAQFETTQRVDPQVKWAKLNALSEGAGLAGTARHTTIS
jgi:5-methyltetrahydropteroyltriglutamate--homocysteine methyltransferase